MQNKDQLQRFIFEHADIRGSIVRMEKSYQQIIQQQNYPPKVKQLLGEALLACLLLADSIKFEGRLSLQFQGDKRLSMLLVQCDHQLQLRGFARFTENLSDEDYEQAFLNGQLALTISPDKSTQAYQSLVSINSSSMAENLMYYFAQSEQLSTRIWLTADETQVAGMMLQLLPEGGSLEREEFWEYATQIGQTITKEELLSLDNIEILHRLYHETELRIFDPRPIAFKCQCSQDKMREVLRVLGEEEAKELLQEQQSIQVSCDFCNQEYQFDDIDIAIIFKKSGH